MRTKTLHTLRTSALLPSLALAMALILVTGQALNCCRLNETLSTSLGEALKVLTFAHGHAKTPAAPREGKSHPGCHGHGPSTASPATSVPMEAGEPRWQAEDPCLSEMAFAPEGMPSTSPDLSSLFQGSPSLLLATLAQGPVRVEKPRPQNKSSPPIYLLTLRLLV